MDTGIQWKRWRDAGGLAGVQAGRVALAWDAVEAAVRGAGRQVRVAVAARDSADYLGSLAGALCGGAAEIFLFNPGWGVSEMTSAAAIAGRGRAAVGCPTGVSLLEERPVAEGGPWIMVATGGTCGGVRFARHTPATLGAAAAGFAPHFGLPRVNALVLLPFHHVSGLMPAWRAMVSGGKLWPGSWEEVERGDFPDVAGGKESPASRLLHEEPWCLSLVPTQLARLLARSEAVNWLRLFSVASLGGAAATRELLNAAAVAGLPVSISYGMTETSAQVCALKPEEFLAGARDCGRPLPHAEVDVGADGGIRVRTPSLFRGYYPEPAGCRRGGGVVDAGFWDTGDLGEWTAGGGLRVLGRRAEVIVTGGEKVFPAEVEEAIRSLFPGVKVAVAGVPDPEWGQRVVACVAAETPVDAEKCRKGLRRLLAAHKVPGEFVVVETWPEENAMGKLGRSAFRADGQDSKANSQ